jgi:hypothetical protein
VSVTQRDSSGWELRLYFGVNAKRCVNLFKMGLFWLEIW